MSHLGGRLIEILQSEEEEEKSNEKKKRTALGTYRMMSKGLMCRWLETHTEGERV